MARYKLKRNKFSINRHDIVIENKNISGIDFPYYIVAFCNDEEIGNINLKKSPNNVLQLCGSDDIYYEGIETVISAERRKPDMSAFWGIWIYIFKVGEIWAVLDISIH